MNSKNTELFRQAGAALAASSPEVKKVVALTREVVEIDKTIEELEELLTSAKARRHAIRSSELPDAMAAMGSSDWTNSSGMVRVQVEDFVSGSLPKLAEPGSEEYDASVKKRDAAIRWLEKNGGSSIIKTEVNLLFGREEHKNAVALVKELKKKKLYPILQSGVHPQTLMAFAREKAKNGEEVAYETLGLFAGRMAKITLNKDGAKPSVAAKGKKK